MKKIFSKMLFILILPIIAHGRITSGTVEVSLSSTSYCEDKQFLQSYSKVLIEGVRKRFSEGTAYYDIQGLKKLVKKCNYNIRDKYGIDDFQIKLWENINNKTHMTKLKNEIEDLVQTGEGSKSLDKYIEFLKKIDQYNENDNQINLWTNQLKQQQEIEQKQCTPSVDMRSKFGPVRDQDSIGWCYAFATADLLSYKTGQRISAIDVAASYNLENSKYVGVFLKKYFSFSETDFESGLEVHALKASMERGLCLEKNLSSEDVDLVNLKQSIKDVEANYDIFVKIKSSSYGQLLKAGCRYDSLKMLFPNLSINDFSEILSKSTRSNFYTNLVDKACGKRIAANYAIEKQFVLFSDTSSKIKKFRDVDTQLRKNNPVMVTTNGLFTGEFSEAHAMLLIGKVWDAESKQCNYILRNSWGASCMGMNSKFDCQDGNIFVPKSKLIKNLQQITYIKD